jgi:NhaA family Na+:H+ antiporter
MEPGGAAYLWRIGGLILPALIFVGIDSMEAKGWAIPTATDIAFALGVPSLFGDCVPPVLKTFLLALAVADDLAAIIINALFDTSELSLLALAAAGLFLASLATLNLTGVKRGAPHLILDMLLWVAVLKVWGSGDAGRRRVGLCYPVGTRCARPIIGRKL